MGKTIDERFESLLNAESAAGWTARLTAAYFDADARRKVVEEIRQGIVTLAPGIAPDELNTLQQRVLSHLVGQASRDARPPDRGSEAGTPLPSGPELEDQVISTYPNPIATPYRSLIEQESAAASFGCLLDAFESLIHFLATVAVSAYLRGGLASAECNRHLLERLVKNAWATGDLFVLLRDTVRLAGDCEGRLPYKELPGYLLDARGRPTASLRVLESFVGLRNRVWGHGTGRDEAFFEGILGPNRSRFDLELARAGWLAGWELVRPVEIDESGRVRRADRLMGERRLKGRPYDLELAPGDREDRGGDVCPEKSLLLVAPDQVRYLPLFPMSLFHFHLRSQGVYFLQRPQWQRSAAGRRLRKAFYVAYESGLGEHEEGPGEATARSLEQHVARLESRLADVEVVDAGASGEPDRAIEPDHELPEVRHEQQFHVRTFAGREGLLRRIDAWVEGETGGGYLLILGPPGQGKSALMAELARRQGKGRGCLLHMIKSHRNPLKFLPALISQAARLARMPFGAAAYGGDVDDLRNALVKALETVVVKTGRGVVVLDALDELDVSGQRIAFLPESLPSGVRVVLTCRPDIPLVQALRARLRDLDEWDLPPLSEEDLAMVLERRLGSETVAAMEGQVDWRGLFQQLHGNPLFLHRALDQIVREAARARQDGRPLQIDPGLFPATLEALFHDIYTEISEKQGTRSTRPEGRQKARLLHLLCLAREPLGLEPLMELMATEGTTLSLENCRDRVLEISQFLLDVGGNRFKPWHQGLVDHVRASILGEAGCRQVETVFCAWFPKTAGRRTPYELRHRVRHMLAARQFDDLGALLTDPVFLEAKAEAGLIYDLVSDFGEAARNLPSGHPSSGILRLLERALLADAYFLARHPTALFQCLWNRGWWYDHPEAAQHYEPSEDRSPHEDPPWNQPGPKFSEMMERWKRRKEQQSPGFVWIRSLRPPRLLLGGSQRVVLRGHASSVTSVAFSGDGSSVASGCYDRTVRIWDAETGAERFCLRGHEASVTCVAFAPDSRLVASGSGDRTVRVWDTMTGIERLRLRGPEATITCVAFAFDGRCLAATSVDGTFRI
jgi:hypothetical protein